ncbi:NAD(P)H-dependent oxidoreductase [Lactobacillaceae bacterium L1_55_11]|nr:NAD(P)H-dependent oxidoreductase [Lactobacillaceae bacterium L1_55_11]
MNILVIYAYPNHTGLNYAILNRIRKNLNSRHKVKILDLYEDDFNPILVFNQAHRRRDLDQDPAMGPYRKMVQEADFLIFVYPIWWGGMPAILKGFIDRVFVKGFAYHYPNGGLRPEGLLPGKSAWIVNTCDTPGFYIKLFQEDYGRILKRQVLKMCGIHVQKHSRLNFVRRSSLAKREKFLDKVGNYAREI